MFKIIAVLVMFLMTAFGDKDMAMNETYTVIQEFMQECVDEEMIVDYSVDMYPEENAVIATYELYDEYDNDVIGYIVLDGQGNWDNEIHIFSVNGVEVE